MRFNMGTQTNVIAIMTTGMTRAMMLSDINLSPYDSQQERRLEGRNSPRGRQNSLSGQRRRSRALGRLDEFQAQFDMLCEEVDGAWRMTQLA
jgi:hypothetical protein